MNKKTGILRRFLEYGYRIGVSVFYAWITFELFVLGAGALFSRLEGKSLMDGMRWANDTAFTIGYGRVYPETGAGEVLQMVMERVWILIFIPVLAAHVLVALIKAHNEWTHREQEYNFDMLRLTVRRLRWCMYVLKAIALKVGVTNLPPMPGEQLDGTLEAEPAEPADTSDGDVEDEVLHDLANDPQHQRQEAFARTLVSVP